MFSPLRDVLLYTNIEVVMKLKTSVVYVCMTNRLKFVDWHVDQHFFVIATSKAVEIFDGSFWNFISDLKRDFYGFVIGAVVYSREI